MTFTGKFQLSVTKALRDQLLAALDQLEPALLDDANLSQVEERAGVYQLFVKGELVYVGKADRNLRVRIRQHQKKLGGRIGGLLTETHFKCVYVDEDLDAIAPETMLIAHYRGQNQAPWNFNGFGNKDPGKNRDKSLVKSDHFDSLYPIDLDQSINFSISNDESLLSAMTRFKGALPFVFRFGNIPSALKIESQELSQRTVREWIDRLGARLPVGWSVIALPGYVIAYDELQSSDFRSRLGSWSKREDETWIWEGNEPEFDATDSTRASTGVDSASEDQEGSPLAD